MVVVALSACSPDSATAPQANVQAPASGSTARAEAGNGSTPGVPKFEVPYMEYAIDHHAMGVQMATLCLQKAVHQELKDLCAMNRQNQMREIAELQAWLQEWYGIPHEPQMQPGDERMMEKLAALPPAEFEIEFMEMLSQHHWIIIHRSMPIALNAIHPELQQMAENIITAQYEDVRKLRTWLCEWYDVCRPVPPLPASVS